MKTALILSVLLASLTLVGCKPKEATLRGQVFIVTRGGENIKLGLVEVQLLEKQQVIEFLQEKQVAIDSEVAARQQEYTVAKSFYEKAAADFNTLQTNSPLTKSNYEEMKARQETLKGEVRELAETVLAIRDEGAKLAAKVDAANAALHSARIRGEHPEKYVLTVFDANGAFQKFEENLPKKLEELTTKASEKNEQVKLLKEKMEKIARDTETQERPLKEKLAAAATRLRNATLKLNEPYPKAETYFADFVPSVIQKTLTDADGKFSISYPRDKSFAIFAQAQRLIGDRTENYFWLVNAPTGKENAQIFLSNNNLVFADPDGYFKIKPQPEAQE